MMQRKKERCTCRWLFRVQGHRRDNGSGQQLRGTEAVVWLQQRGQRLSLSSELRAIPVFDSFPRPSLTSFTRKVLVKHKRF